MWSFASRIALLTVVSWPSAAPCIDAFQFQTSPLPIPRPRSGYSSNNKIGRCSSPSGNTHNSFGGRTSDRRHGSPLEMAPLIKEDLNGDATTTNEQVPTDDEVNDTTATPASIPDDKITYITSTSTSGFTAIPSTRQLPTNWLGEKTYILFTAILIGLFTGTNIAVFKTAVEFVREALYGDGIKLPLLNPTLWNAGGGELLFFSLRISEVLPVSAIPVLGGLVVGLLLRFGGDMPPGLRDTVKEGMILHLCFSCLLCFWLNRRIFDHISLISFFFCRKNS